MTINKKIISERLSKYIFPQFVLEIGAVVLMAPGFLFSFELLKDFLGYIGYAFLVLWFGSKIYYSSHSFTQKVLVLCVSHAMLLFPIFFIMAAAVGGMASGWISSVNVVNRYLAYLSKGSTDVLYAMVFFIPWSIFWTYRESENMKQEKLS